MERYIPILGLLEQWWQVNPTFHSVEIVHDAPEEKQEKTMVIS